MFVNRLHILFTLALATAAGVSAQNIPACVLNCSTTALSGSGCTSLTDFKCLCASTAFQSTAAACINSTCSSSDQAAALQLEQAECGSQSNTTKTTTPASSPSSSSASTSKSSNAIAPIQQLPFVTVFIAIAGVALGGTFVL